MSEEVNRKLPSRNTLYIDPVRHNAVLQKDRQTYGRTDGQHYDAIAIILPFTLLFFNRSVLSNCIDFVGWGKGANAIVAVAVALIRKCLRVRVRGTVVVSAW